MTKRLIIISFLLFITTFSCQKKLFKSVTVIGCLIDGATQKPLANTNVALYTDDASSAKNSSENTIGLASTTTNSDGTFKLTSKSSKRNRYYKVQKFFNHSISKWLREIFSIRQFNNRPWRRHRSKINGNVTSANIL